MNQTCVYCTTEGGALLYRDDLCRVVLADEPFTGFARVIANAHVREMTDLPESQRSHLMRAVYATESAQRVAAPRSAPPDFAERMRALIVAAMQGSKA